MIRIVLDFSVMATSLAGPLCSRLCVGQQAAGRAAGTYSTWREMGSGQQQTTGNNKDVSIWNSDGGFDV
jgi:hypothetical protein